ncbi:MAG TPA: S8 family serine peptidase, partial [Bdellovibrionales bacterium]|nr:S8 family serine peptidase [Bdellovibrionales bacterium]
GRNYIVNKGVVDPSAWNDDNGHGSHVAGTIAAADNAIGAVGVAPDARLWAVKVLNRRGTGYLSDIADGIAECVRAGSDVINMSLGATADPAQDSPMKNAIDAAVAAGVKVVVAAGNEGQNINQTVPAGYSNVIAVSAIDSADQFPSWSNYGLSLKDYAAPGVSIYSTWKSGGYNTISGTSMASPHVAGVVALQLASGRPALGYVDIMAAVSRQGRGRIDALLTVSP